QRRTLTAQKDTKAPSHKERPLQKLFMRPFFVALCLCVFVFTLMGGWGISLIRSRKDDAAFGRAVASDTLPWLGLGLHGYAADRGFGFIFDPPLAFSRSAPVAPEKSAVPVEYLYEFFVVVDTVAV